jgi:hypothetical protein
VTMEVTMIVIVAVTVILTIHDNLSTFIFQGSRMGQGKGVVASFRLVPKNIGSWRFLQVGA